MNFEQIVILNFVTYINLQNCALIESTLLYLDF
jgi:hypothetical protein